MSEIRYPHRFFEQATGLIEYEFKAKKSLRLLDLNEYNPKENNNARPDFQLSRIRGLFKTHSDLADCLIDLAARYNDALMSEDVRRVSNFNKFNELYALRLRSLHTIADALSRVVGVEAAFDILVEREETAGGGLLEFAMTLHPRLNESGCLEIDTGDLSLEDYSEHFSQVFKEIVASAQPSYN